MVEVILMQKRPPKSQNKRRPHPPKNPKKTKKSKLQLVVHSLCLCTLPFPAPSPRPHLCVPLQRRSLCFCVWSSLERRWAMVAGGCSGKRKGCREGMERRLALAVGHRRYRGQQAAVTRNWLWTDSPGSAPLSHAFRHFSCAPVCCSFLPGSLKS